MQDRHGVPLAVGDRVRVRIAVTDTNTVEHVGTENEGVVRGEFYAGGINVHFPHAPLGPVEWIVASGEVERLTPSLESEVLNILLGR